MISHNSEEERFRLNDGYYLIIDNDIRIFKTYIKFWFEKVLLDLSLQHNIIDKGFKIKIIVFSFSDFQIEGLYYAFKKWFSEFYNLDVVENNIQFSKQLNQYIFLDIQDYIDEFQICSKTKKRIDSFRSTQNK